MCEGKDLEMLTLEVLRVQLCVRVGGYVGGLAGGSAGEWVVR